MTDYLPSADGFPVPLTPETPIEDLAEACRAAPDDPVPRILHATACARAKRGERACPYAEGSAEVVAWMQTYRRVARETAGADVPTPAKSPSPGLAERLGRTAQAARPSPARFIRSEDPTGLLDGWGGREEE